MAELEVSVNGKPYTIKCDDGQEDQVAQLAEVVNGKVADLTRTIGQVGDARLLLMAGLLIADDLNNARALIRRQENGQPCAPQESDEVQHLGKSIVDELDALADRIESIAASLEHA